MLAARKSNGSTDMGKERISGARKRPVTAPGLRPREDQGQGPGEDLIEIEILEGFSNYFEAPVEIAPGDLGLIPGHGALVDAG